MLTIEQLRAAAGGLNNLSDEQIAQAAYEANKHYYPDQNAFYREIGYNPGDNFVRGMRIAGNNTLAATAGMGALAADVVGADGVKDDLLSYGQRKAQRAMQLGRRSDDVDNFMEAPGAFLASAAGQGVGYAAPSLLGGGAGALVARRLGVNALGGAAVGGYAANTSQEAGGIYNDQVEAGNPQPLKALGYGAAAGALDTIPEALGAGRFLKGGKGSLKGMAKGAVKQAGEEAITETGQTVLERMGADKSLTDDDAWHDYRNSAALGAVGGGMFGAATGIRRTPAPVATVDENPDLLGGNPPMQPAQPQVPVQETTPEQDATLAEVPGVPLTEAAQPEVAEAPAAEAPEDPNAAIRQEIAARKQMIEQAKGRGEEYGLKGNKQIELMLQLEALRDEGKITPEEFHENIVTTGVGGKFGAVQKFIDEKSGKIQPKQPKAKKAAATPAAAPTAAAPIAAPAAAPQEVTSAPQPVAPAPEAVASPVAAPAPAPVSGEAGTPGVPAAGAKPAEAPAVAAPAPTTKAPVGTIRVVKKNAAKAAPAPVSKPAPAPAVAPEEQFDNYPDFVDWALKKVGATEAQADAFKMKGGSTETAAAGIGEYAGITSSTRKIGAKHGVSGQQVSNWVKDLAPKVKALELAHLVSKKRQTEEASAPEQVVDLAETEDGDAVLAEKPEDNTPMSSDDAGAAAGAISDDFDAVDHDASNESSGIQIRDRMGSGGETEATNDDVADKTYKRAKANTGDNKAAWEAHGGDVPWSKLGPGQQAWFAEARKLGKDAEKEAHENISESSREGIRLTATDADIVDSVLSKADHLVTAETLAVDPATVLKKATLPFAHFTSFEQQYNTQFAPLGEEMRPMAAAMQTLLNGPHKIFFQYAMSRVGTMFVSLNPDRKESGLGDMAAWPMRGMAISVTKGAFAVQGAIENPGSRRFAARVTSCLAHELTHIAEYFANLDPFGTKHAIYAKPNAEGTRLVFHATEVAEEAMNAHAVLDAILSDPPPGIDRAEVQDALMNLDYALGPLNTAASAFTDGADVDTETWGKANYHATVELLPVLVQLHLEHRELMSWLMPRSSEYVTSVLANPGGAGNISDWRRHIQATTKGEGFGQYDIRRNQGSAASVFSQVRGAAQAASRGTDGRGQAAAAEVAGREQASAASTDREQAGQADRGLSPRAVVGVVSPKKARRMTEDMVARWTDPNRPDGADSEPINPKVKNLVDALNDLGVITTLSGDMYSDDLVYVDLSHDLPYTAGEGIKNLPEGWKAGTTAFLHTQALHDVAGVGDVWKNPDLAAEELERYGISAGVRISRAGAQGVTRQEAEAVAAAVKQSLEAMEGGSTRFSAGPRAVAQSAPPAGIEVAQDETPTLDDLPPAPDGTGRGLKNWAMALVQHKWRAMPGLLGALSTEQLADRFKDLPGKGGEAIKRFHAAMTRMSVRASTVMAASDAVKREWEALAKKHGTRADQQFVDFLMRATQAQIWPDEAFTHESNKHIKDTVENRALHAQLKTTFDRLPTDYQALFRTLQKDFSEKYQAKVKALRDGIIDGYVAPEGSSLGLSKADLVRAAAMTKAERKAYLKTVGTTKLRIDTLRSMWTDLDDHADQFPTKLDGPYFPMMRFGDHIISVKSATYLAAEKAFVTAKDALEALYAGDGYKPVAELEFQVHDAEGAVARAKTEQSKADRQAELDDLRQQLEAAMKPVEVAREKLKKAQQALTKLKGDSSHYLVEMYEHIGEASAREKQLKAELQRRGIDPGNVKYQLKDKYLQGLDAVQPAFMKKLGERLSSALPETEAAKVKNTMRELYMQMQPDRSALKAQIRRLGVAGFTKEALRAYAASSVRDAWHISRLENATPARDAMNELRFSDDMDSKLVGNELAKRVAQNMQMADTKWLSAATNLTYMTYLGMSPAFALNQLTQPFVISLPVMAARHGAGAMNALGKGWKDAAQIVKASYKAQQSYHFTADPEGAAAKGLISADEAKMLRAMFDSGRIDITITHDLSNTAEGKDNWLGKAAALSAWPAQQAEVINRISTALAAYRLERKAGKSAEAATTYADKVISETHLNYASENRARWFHANSFGGWGKVMFQFRSYQQGMLFLLGKNMMEAVRGDKEAAKAVGYLMGAQLAAAGTTGLPFVAPLLWVTSKALKALLDKDEERDLEEMLYQGAASVLGEKGARTLMKGIPAGLGVDLSGAIGLGNIMSPVPYVADKTNGRDQVAAYWIALTGGAPAGMVQNWAAALDAANKGDIAKAVGLATPMKGLSNAVKGAAQGMDGLVDSKGNEIVSPQDMDPADVVAKMLGFTTTDMARLQERRGAFFEAKQNIKDARNQILNDLVKARMAGKPDGDALEAQREFNQRNPEQRITVGNVMQAIQRRRQEAAAMKKTGGLPVGKRYKALGEEFTEE